MQHPTLTPVGTFRPLFELGRGGMGAAYLSRAIGAERFERLVVVKRLHAHLTTIPQALERFLDEARLAAHVRHANVVGTQHVGRDEQGPYLVLDYVEGASLDHLVDRLALRGQRCPEPIALRITLDALAGLQAVHEATDTRGRELRMLHRDVTLQNVLVGRDGVARIADFGIAKSALGSVVTDERYLVGKLLYMPPEYLRRASTDVRLDVYALGVTLWLLLTGRELWAGATEEQLVTHVLQDPLPALSNESHAFAPQIEALVARATAKRVEDRFSSAREMATEIERIARDTGWLASHAEVAEVVEGLCGGDLAERRARVAAMIGSAASEPPGAAAAASGPRPAPRPRALLIAASAALVLAALALAYLRVGKAPAGSGAASLATSSAVPGTEERHPAPREGRESQSVASSVVPPAPLSGPPSTFDAAAPPRRLPAVNAPAGASAPRPPDGISKANPYLK